MKINMHLRKEAFELAALGVKNVEARLYDEKRQQLKVGDYIEFENRANGAKLQAEITSLPTFANFHELFKCYDQTRLGYASDEKVDESVLNRFYSPARQRCYGVVAIEFRLTSAAAGDDLDDMKYI